MEWPYPFFVMEWIEPTSTNYNRRTNKTDLSKPWHQLFGGKPLTDEKSALFCSRWIFNVAHHSLPFCLNFRAVRTDSVGKRCDGKLGSTSGRPFGHSSPKTRKSTIMYCKTIKKITWGAHNKEHNSNQKKDPSWWLRDAASTPRRRKLPTSPTTTRTTTTAAMGGGGF